MFDSDQPREKSSLHWDEKQNTLTLRLPDVRDPTGSIDHDYELILSLEDLNLMIDFLSKDPLAKSGQAFSEGLLGSNHPLLRLLLSPLISEMAALSHDVTTKSGEMVQTLLQMKAELSRLQAKIQRIESQQNERPVQSQGTSA